jgi:hypothetical protein
MSAPAIAAVLSRQRELIAALDAQDVDRIVLATEALAAATSELRGTVHWPDDPDIADQFSEALQSNEAAAVRINLFRFWNCQRIDQVQELRGERFRSGGYKSI